MKQSIQTSHETSWHGHDFRATYNELVEKLGAPNESGDGYKSRYCWVMETEGGDLFTIYDWKEPFLDHDLDIYWHIGALTPLSAGKGLKELEKAFG